MAEDTFVVVGAGLAGAKAVEAMREAGFGGRVVLIGDEADRPYERPPLSKELLRGVKGREKVWVHDEGWYAEHDVELLLATSATAIDPGGRVVSLSTGDQVHYDKLLLATGSSPRRLDLPGAGLDGIRYLRRVGEAEALRDTLAGLGSGGRLVVVGAGWIGLEVAAAARHHGVEVTVVEPQAQPLLGVLGDQVGEVFAALHRAQGVDLRLGTGVEGFDGLGAGRVGVRTSDGTVEGDLVVIGVGIVPNTALAEAAGLEVADGVVVDELLRTSDPAVYAAGDVANAMNPLLGTRVRVEHWANAQNQGAAAGASMAGHGEPYAKLPYFFTDQYDLSMEYHGYVGRQAPDVADRVVLRGDPAGESWLAFWLGGNRVLAGMNVNDWDAADGIKALAKARREVDPARLADPAVPLAEL